MSKIIFNILFSLLMIYPSHCKAQNPDYFEGTITYKGDFIRKTNKYDSIILKAFAGETSTIYVKEGNCLEIVDGGITTRLLYRKDMNRFYRERFNSDTVYWTRCDQPGQKILKLEKIPNVEKILGIDCDELKVYYENRTVTYYYNSNSLRTNPEWFKNSTSFNENIYSREMKSVNLKSIIEYKDFVIIQTAIKITRQVLDNSIFEILNKPLIEDQ